MWGMPAVGGSLSCYKIFVTSCHCYYYYQAASHLVKWHIAAHRVAWSVDRSVFWTHSSALQKRLNLSRCHLGGRLWWAYETMY